MQDKLTQVQEQAGVSSRPEGAGKKGSSAGWVWLLVVAVIGAGGYYAWRSARQPQTTAAAQRGRRGQGDAQGGGAVPVVVATAARENLPVYLDGLGSAQAFYTVTLKSRVDGELIEVNFKEGQDVKKGDQLAVIDPRPFQVALAQAQANLAKDQSQLADAKLNANRYDQLVKEGVIPQQQYDTQKALAGQFEGGVAADQAQIDNAKLNLVYSRITSPIDGRVGLRLVDPGNIVHASDPNGLLVITQVQPISVIFTLPEDNLPAVVSRMRQGSLPVKAMSRDAGTELASGMLQTIDNQIDQTTGTFRLKAVFDNKDRSLWPNQFVNARLLLNVQQGAIIVPSAAIQNGSQGSFVYAVKQDRTVEVRPVTVGITEGNVVSIASGLSAGEQVVTDGQDKLRAGIAVDPRPDARSVGGPGRGDAQPGAAAPSDGASGTSDGAHRQGQRGAQPASPSGLAPDDSGQRGQRGARGQVGRPKS